ncbi:MAG: hypothetical protein Q9187_007146 [Circinaria calcarea]
MAIYKTISSIARCSSCRHEVLSVFAGFAGLSIQPARQLKRVLLPAIEPAFSRNFSSSKALRSEVVTQNENQENEMVVYRPPGTSDTRSEIPNSKEAPSIPWYLQVQGPQRIESPLSERQRLPELPSNAPPLLQPILEHISVDLGLDDLSLFDLRKLNPPPALGANLLMVMGTARSEKHLHVSADRFCRWLRTIYKLKPYADGLIGRNELKLKMRRKARRTRLLSNVGSSDDGNADDGIRTGWVCVNVGAIENAEDVSKEVEESDNFVGFGGHAEGVKLVVQMLTQEKREELDLEGLWGGTLARQERKEAREAEKRVELEHLRPEEVGYKSSYASDPSADMNLLTATSLRNSTSILPTQIRALHTSSRRYTVKKMGVASEYEDVPTSDLEPRIMMPNVAEALEEGTVKQPTTFDQSAGLVALKALIRYLKGLPKEDAVDVLGRGSNDLGSTSFLQSFYSHVSPVSDIKVLACRVELVSYAVSIGHPGYTKIDLIELVFEAQSSPVNIPERLLWNAFHTLLIPDKEANIVSTTGREMTQLVLSMESLNSAMDLLEDISLRGIDIIHEAVFSDLLKALHRVRYASDINKGPSLRENAIWRLMRIMDKQGLPANKFLDNAAILQDLATAEDWDEYWRHWRGMARRMQRRSAKLYTRMFRDVAQSVNQARCVEALSDWVPEMEREEPPVSLRGDLARAVIDCLRVADPRVEDQVRQQSNEDGQWVRLWKRCLWSLQREERSENKTGIEPSEQDKVYDRNRQTI